MIAVVAAQLAARRGQAVLLFLLSTVLVAAAVSVPLYAASVDRSIIADELAAGDGSDLVISVGAPRGGTGPDAAPGVLPAAPPEPPAGLASVADARAALALFTPVTTVQVDVLGLASGAPGEVHRLLARDGFCHHVTFQRGRCPVGGREAAVPVAVADEAGIGPGDVVELTPARPSDGGSGWVVDGPPATIVVVGVFDPADPADPYWAVQDPLGRQDFLAPAIMTNRALAQTMPHGQATYHVDAVLPPDLLTPERIPEIRRQLEASVRLTLAGELGTEPASALPRLLDRIVDHGDQARDFLPIAVAPLVLLGWFVVYVTVGDGVAGRRREVAAVAAHGATRWTRAVAVTAESLLPLLLAAPAALVVAHAVVELAGPAGSGPINVDGAQLLAAGVTTAGSVAAALLAVRRQVSTPLVQLLREVSPRRRRIVVATTEVLVVALGGLVLVERWTTHGDLAGAMVAAPLAVTGAVAVLAAWGIQPMVRLAGSWSLRRGRLAPAMAALYVARRSGAARLVIVLALVLGTVGFAVTAADVAAQARTAEAERTLGADRVLEVRDAGRAELLWAVRAADPDGRYAMAVVSAPGSGSPFVAVDVARLEHVALGFGREGGVDGRQVAELLRPPAVEPVLVGDGELVAELSPGPRRSDDALTVSVLLAPGAGDPVVVRFGPLTAGRQSYRAEVSGCPDRCRLAAITLDRAGTGYESVALTLHALHEGEQSVLPADRLGDPARWRAPEASVASGQQLYAEPAAGGLQLRTVGIEPAGGYTLLAADGPYPLPVISSGDLPALVDGLDGERIQVASQAGLDYLPGVGGDGMLADLEYAENLTAGSGDAESPQVWLAADAPAGMADELRASGLTIVGERTVDDALTALERSGAAIALRFQAGVAGATILVGLAAFALVVVVDRNAWNQGLRSLRLQGVGDRTTLSAARWSYSAMVLAGAAMGLVAGAAAWVVVGERLPLGLDPALFTLWPRWTYLLVPWLLAAGVFALAAFAGAGILRRHRAGSTISTSTEGG